MANALNPQDGYGDYTDEQLKALPGAPTRGAQGGYVYGWRPQAYTDILGENDVASQQGITAFRQQAGGGAAEDDTGALAQMSGQAPLKNATPAQQWNAQPAAQAPVAAGPGQGQAGSNDLFSLLMQRAQQPETVGRNDPNVRAQADAFSANQQRGARNTIADLAESQGPLANLGAETRLANERAGQASGGFEAELMGRETSARRDEIQQALSEWGAMLSDQQRTQLQHELASMNDSLQRSQLAQQGTQFNLNQSQNMDQFLRELGLREAAQNDTSALNWAQLGL